MNDAALTEVASDVDARAVRMLEKDSYERVVEGLKLAADGCRHLVVRREEGQWNKLADFFDSVRKAVVQLSGSGASKDAAPTVVLWGQCTLDKIDAYSRVYNGLTDAARAARQLATCHRGDLRWSLYADRFELMRDQASSLARQKKTTPLLQFPN